MREGGARTWLASAAVALSVGATACAAPSRLLSTRVVEDPIVLPRRLASLTLGGGVAHQEPLGSPRSFTTANFRLGLTDRLEWTDLLSLRYALLDDRPADGRPARPLSLAVQAGFRGIGYSSLEGMIVLPSAAVQTLKHVGDRWALGLSFTWLANWVQRPVMLWSKNDLVYTSSRRSTWTLSGFATRQLGDRFALSLGAWVNDTATCISPTCDWLTRGAGGSLRVVFRPWPWMTLGAGPYAGLRQRTDTPLPPPDPADPIVITPRRVEWLGISGSAAVYW